MLRTVTKSTHTAHRKSLTQAVNIFNRQRQACNEQLYIIVGTKNIIKMLPWLILGMRPCICYYTSFGRLFTDYGAYGRLAFWIAAHLMDKTVARGFIVENSDEQIRIEKHLRRPVFLTRGSGLDTSGFGKPPPVCDKRSRKIRLGYIARFGKIKCSALILKIAQELPPDIELVIAGDDIGKKKYYQKQFARLAQTRSNIRFIGHLPTRAAVGDFFCGIDMLLYPSLHEGLPLTLLESIWHGVPFVTTRAPGCWQTAEVFDCASVPRDDFVRFILSKDFMRKRHQTSDWPKRLKAYEHQQVTKDFCKIFEQLTS